MGDDTAQDSPCCPNPTDSSGASATGAAAGGRLEVEAILSVDERGQMVLPKEVRMRMGIGPADKLVVVTSHGESGEPCCLMLMKVDKLASMVKNAVGPLLAAVLAGD